MSVTTPAAPALSFELLVTAIGQAHAELAAQASRAVNASLTLRNWLIGFHIEEYERRGVDRQQYGEKLLDRLAESLQQKGVSRCDRRELYRYRQFYLTYPQIVEALPPQSASRLGDAAPAQAAGIRIVESVTPQSGIDGHWSCPGLVDTSPFGGKEFAMPKTHRVYPPEFRRQIIELVGAGRASRSAWRG